jgi:lincosamide nucleotidyltransferase A/C/D/E
MISWTDSELLTKALFAQGFQDVHTDDRKDRNFILGHPSHGEIDFHVFELKDDGSELYGPGEVDWAISAEELNAQGSIGGKVVRCLSPEYQIRSHTGYQLKETDYADTQALSERFGIALLEEQRK